MKFRGAIPEHKTRLRLPFLAHQTFRANIIQWLRHQVLSNKHWLIPLHLPSHVVEEGAHLSVEKLLLNFQYWETKMCNLDPMTLPCSCVVSSSPLILELMLLMAMLLPAQHYWIYLFDYNH